MVAKKQFVTIFSKPDNAKFTFRVADIAAISIGEHDCKTVVQIWLRGTETPYNFCYWLADEQEKQEAKSVLRLLRGAYAA